VPFVYRRTKLEYMGVNLGYGRSNQAHVLTAQTLLLLLLLLITLMMGIYICYLKQTIFLRYTALKLFCVYNIWYI